jgi:hypothetical protein
MAERKVAVVVSGFNLEPGTGADASVLERYMPAGGNYQVKVVERGPSWGGGAPVILIDGYDHAGWTMQDYVIPRLASALIFAVEVV